MNAENQACAVDGPQMAIAAGMPYPGDIKSEQMSFVRHKELTNLAYGVKAFIDAHGGLKNHETCGFGALMSSIINLK